MGTIFSRVRNIAGSWGGKAVIVSILVWLLGTLKRGSQHTLLWTLLKYGTPPKVVYCGDGVEPGYEKVEAVFRKHFNDGIERTAQFSAYVDGRRVVDLCGKRVDLHSHYDKYDPESLQVVFSSTKCLSSIVVAMLSDRGHLRYDMRVAEVWPEYGCNGKEHTTIAQVMRHEAGLVMLSNPINAEDLQRDRIKANAIGALIEKETPNWDTTRSYHYMTRGFIVNEIVRRCDPKGRTVGEFVAEEIDKKLNLNGGFQVGLSSSEQSVNNNGRVFDVVHTKFLWAWLQSWVPKRLGRKISINFFWYTLVIGAFIGQQLIKKLRGDKTKIVQVSHTTKGPAASHTTKGGLSLEDKLVRFFNHPEIRTGECPSFNGHANGRSMARIAAAIANNNRGKALDGVSLLSQDGSKTAHGNPVEAPTFGGLATKFTNAGFNIFDTGPPKGLQYRAGCVGWMGYGGSCMQWHRGMNAGFGYASTLLEADLDNRRALHLQMATLECAKAIQNRCKDHESNEKTQSSL